MLLLQTLIVFVCIFAVVCRRWQLILIQDPVLADGILAEGLVLRNGTIVELVDNFTALHIDSGLSKRFRVVCDAKKVAGGPTKHETHLNPIILP